MTEYKPDEIVDVHIKGARVIDTVTTVDGFRYLTVVHGVINSSAEIFLGDPGVTVDRVDPAGWPPRAGDLWRDRDGDLWLTCEHESGLVMVCASGRAGRTVEQATTRFGPLSLVHREGNQS